ncbi:hypothetical protein CJF30_00005293 [Rutstroemia sp. NJR-2017a BBW]|nr:hypothetical protein CJF30_00005293 [Rutstroemia sp. NJR-2017a BBW]
MDPLTERQEKSVHPFFQKPSKTIEIQLDQTEDQPDVENVSKKGPGKGEKKGKKSTIGANTKQQKGTLQFSRSVNGGQADLLEIDPNDGRRKRQKTASPESTPGVEGSVGEMQLPTTPPKTKPQRGRKRKEVSVPHLAGACEPNVKVQVPSLDASNATTLKNKDPAQENAGMPNASLGEEKKQSLEEELKPKKILQFNPKTGTIGSPPKTTVPLKKQLKGKKSANQEAQPKSKVVVITYGTGGNSAADIGLRIDEILTSEKNSMKPKESTKQSKPETSNEVKPVNDANIVPWWKTAAKKKAAAQSEAQEPEIQAPGTERQGKILSLVNPSCLTKTTSTAGIPRSQESKQNVPLFNGFGTASKIQKFPGAIEPAWPWQGAVHIRGDQNQNDLNVPNDNAIIKKSSGKKSKYQAVEVLKKEDIIDSLTTELQISEALNIIQNLHIDEFKPISACLRLPSRHIETGKSLQQRIRKELSCNMSNHVVDESSEDEIQAPASNRTPVHPALRNIYDSIATSLSPFDKSQCENLPWTQKYAPKNTEEVLHNGRETSILREWLQKLTVLSVESGSTDSKAPSKRLAAKLDAPGKRKRKSKKLDGFIVSSDEEDNDMDEITDPEDEVSAEDGPGLIKKTVIRSGDMNPKGSKDSKRLTNAVVMSGPHGCGKTATVYAVAKELGFEVFEINSSSRRSGKDVMERVGDMTRNHLVQGPNNDQPPIIADDDEKRLSNAVADDLKTGRQGTMSSFFKIKEPSKPKPKPKDKLPNPPKEVIIPKGPAKQQKQSLILLEEIDILYEEDRGFWQTIMLLIAQSKRPIIMTCNDESAVPLSALSLHAIIRFNSIPTDLATDYMLLVAANEGHALRREAIKALYESRKLDFRGSMTELDFWCQFAVGDRKAGLEWFYPRMPAGRDLDANGNKNRVISEDTYRTGMGWLSQDSLENQRSHIDAEEETLRQAWDGWSLDAADWQNDVELGAWALKIKDQTHDKISARKALSMYDGFAEAMSAADCCSYYSLGADKNALIDASHPEISSKMREDYLLANPLLDVFPQVNYDETSTNISLWIKSRAKHQLKAQQHTEQGWEMSQEFDSTTETQVLNLIRSQHQPNESLITRRDFSLAFDPISEPEKSSLYTTGTLEASCFDRPLNLIALDVAPFVRSIVAFDARLAKDRLRLSNLLSQGGSSKAPKTKRMRTTRAAMSALEGGVRSTTRRERYFGPGLNAHLVMRTGGKSWADAVTATTGTVTGTATREGSRRSSVQMSEGSTEFGAGVDSGRDELN